MKHFLIKLICAASALLTGGICAAQQKEELQNALVTAVEHFTEADYDAARSILDSLGKAGPEDDAVEYYLGLCDIVSRDYKSAEEHFSKAVAIDSTNYWYQDWLANVYTGTNQIDKAISAYESMLARYPKKNDLYFNLASLYAKKGENEKVLATLDNIETVFGKSDMLISAKMDILNRMGRSGEVIKMLDSIANDTEEEPEKRLQALNTEISVYYGIGDYLSIINVCQRMMALAPQSAEVAVVALSTMGDTYHVTGDMKNTYKCYEKALKIAPDYCPVLNNYAYFLSIEKKKLSKAYAMSKITIEKEPDNATYLDTFGWILFLQGKALEAKPFFKHAMLYGGKESKTVLEHYAQVLRALKEDDLATYYEGLAKGKPEEQ